jgi:dihydrofolate synthase/folylpolyglutamate synthase
MLRQLLPEFDTVIVTCFQNNPRHVPVEALVRLVQNLTDRPLHTAADPAAAWKLASHFAGPEDLICITGSFFIAAEVREMIVNAEEGVMPRL